MCGIAGYVTSGRCDPSSRIIHQMIGEIVHRGPDDCGIYTDSHAVLGHRRLSIIDVNAGHQPMADEGETLWIVYNGEIFNHAELRGELEKAGHRYRTRCDTETIVHAYEQYGGACVEQFRGMFSFAIWDSQNRQLFCARDRLGIKPFYYYSDGKVFVFASEIKALLRHPDLRAELNTRAIPEYLALGYLSGEETMFRGIRKLRPGHSLSLDLRDGALKPNIHCYWDVPVQGCVAGADDRELISECRQRLEDAVRTRMMSDVPLGVFLSGGLDSSAIAALMQKMSEKPVKTFSIGYDEAAYSELSYAQRVARSIGTEHHSTTISRDQFFSTLPRVIWHEDEPAVFSSSVPLYFVSKLASERVKVVLSGEGSDELFGGYERYGYYGLNSALARGYEVLPGALRTAIRNRIETTSLLSSDLRRKLSHTFLARENTFEASQLENFYSAFTRSEIDAIWSPGGRKTAPFESVLGFWQARERSSTLSRMLYTDQKTYLTELLMRQDQMSMAWSIESRVPFLDHHFVEFAMRVPDRLKIHRGERKFILKKAVEDLLPKDIIYRKKMGFPTPLRQWFLDPAADSLLMSLTRKNAFLSSILDVGQIERLLINNRNGVEDCTDRIWRLLNLQLWGDIFLKGKSEAPEIRTDVKSVARMSKAVAS